MIVLVCGGRNYRDSGRVWAKLDELHKEEGIQAVIHGDATGADRIGGAWAKDKGIQEVLCPANWKKHGNMAGPKRNAAMALLKPDMVLAFPGGTGTNHMMGLARSVGIKVLAVENP